MCLVFLLRKFIMFNRQFFVIFLTANLSFGMGNKPDQFPRQLPAENGSTYTFHSYPSATTIIMQSNEHTQSGMSQNGMSQNGMSQNGMSQNGMSQNGMSQTQGQAASATSLTSVEFLTNLSLSMCDFLHDQQKKVCEKSETVLAWVDNHRYLVGATAAVSLYAYIFYKMYQVNQIIYSEKSWSNWQSNKSLESLLLAPRQQLEAELLFEFQSRYIHPTCPTDFIYSIVQSSNSLQAEIDCVAEQINLYEWILVSYVSHAFFVDEHDLANLRDKYKKLLFMQNVFMSWCAHYKIEHN